MKALVFFVIVAFATCSFAYDWTPIGPNDIDANNIFFSETIPYSEVICTSTGIMLFDGTAWEEYTNAGLPATDADVLSTGNILTTLNDNSWSDGIYEFDLNSLQYNVTEYFTEPHFIFKNDFDNNFYIGGSQGLMRSTTGLNWINLEYFNFQNCPEMQENSGHLIVATENEVVLNNYNQVPDFGEYADMGMIELSIIDEASGLIASRRNENVFWTHNDSGGENEVYALNRSGEHLGIYTLEGINNRDWEDISICFDIAEREYYIYVGDIGDNGGSHNVKYIHRFPEPFVSENQAPVSETISVTQTITFEYSDETNHDAETLMTDPQTNDIYIITKRNSGASDKVFRLQFPQSYTETETAEEVCEVSFPVDFIAGRGAVGGDISTSGAEILIKSYDHIYYWLKEPGEQIWQTLQNAFIAAPYSLEIQSEAVCWEPDDSGYYTTSEEYNGIPARLSFYGRDSWAEAVEAPNNIKDAIFVGNDLYGVISNAEPSSGLWSSSNFGNHWELVFSSEFLSSVGADCDDNLFVGWEEPFGTEFGIALSEAGELTFANAGLPNTNINKITTHPLIDCHNMVVCTETGVFMLTDYSDLLDVDNYEIEKTNYELYNHPNPFNPATAISFEIKGLHEEAVIEIFNTKGQKVNQIRITNYEVGINQVLWDAEKVASGIYFYRLRVNDSTVATNKCVLIK